MFSFFNKKPLHIEEITGALGCDLHSHLLPGIDDGAPDMHMSLRLTSGLAELGYARIVTTPHINGDRFPNTPDIVLAGQNAVNAQLEAHGIGVRLRAAAEYLIDDGFVRAFSNDEPLLTVKDKMVLVELSFALPAINLKDILFQLQLKGYRPILAHPERYLYFAANRGWYDQLRDAGCLFQLNLLSFAGYYGPESRRLAEFLVKKKYVDFLGSDLHHERHLEILKTSAVIWRTAGNLLNAGLVRNSEL